MLWNHFKADYVKVCEEGQLTSVQFSYFSAHAHKFSYSRSDPMSDLGNQIKNLNTNYSPQIPHSTPA